MKKVSILLVFILLLAIFSGCRDSLTDTPATQASAAAAHETPQTAQHVDAEGVHPMLFHVTGENGQEMYLFGTIHVGDERTELAMQKLAPIVRKCDALAVEFDIVAYEKDLAAQVEAITQFISEDGSTVDQHMPAELYAQSSALLEEAGLMPNVMKYYNLSMWSQLVEQAALLTKSGLDMNAGMDRALIHFCYENQIEVRDVESPELQYGLLAGFSDELNLLLIESTMKNLEQYGEEVDKLYDAWVEGNYDHVMAVLEEEDTDTSDELSEEQQALVDDYNSRMLTQRNLGMRDRAVEWLKSGDKVFFAVGAAHLVDEGGLVELLRAAGYQVEQVTY